MTKDKQFPMVDQQYILKCQLVAIDLGGNEQGVVATYTSAYASSDRSNMERVLDEMSTAQDDGMESAIDEAVLYPYNSDELEDFDPTGAKLNNAGIDALDYAAQTIIDIVNESKTRQVRELQLPPDPDGNNEIRAERAEAVIVGFMDDEGDDGTSLIDLLADLMHWADRHQISFGDALQSAFTHYQAETTEEEGI